MGDRVDRGPDSVQDPSQCSKHADLSVKKGDEDRPSAGVRVSLARARWKRLQRVQQAVWASVQSMSSEKDQVLSRVEAVLGLVMRAELCDRGVNSPHERLGLPQKAT